MKKKQLFIFISIILFVVVYIGMSYISESTYSNYEVTLNYKVVQGNEYWAEFDDTVTKERLKVKMQKEIWEDINEGNIYIISFKHNELFKDNVLININKQE